MHRVGNWTLGLTLIVLFSGCVTPPPNTNSNTNGSANGNVNSGNGNTNSPPLNLTSEQQTTLNQSVPQIDDLGAALSGLSFLVDPQIDFATPPNFLSVGTCPQIFILTGGDNSVFSIDFSPSANPQGCASAKTANRTVSGIVAFQPFVRSTSTATVTFENYVVSGVSISGTGTQAVSGNSANGVTLTGPIDLTIGDATVEGSISIHINSSGVITLNATDLMMSDGTNAFVVDLSNVAIDPAGNSSFVPEAGTAVVGNGSGALQVTFLANSFSSGTVQVSIQGGGSTTYIVPAIGG